VIGKCFSFDQFKNEEMPALEFPELVNRSNVGMVQRCKQFRFALEAGQAVRVLLKVFGQRLMATSRSSLVSLDRLPGCEAGNKITVHRSSVANVFAWAEMLVPQILSAR
jgi:hypothetical protein